MSMKSSLKILLLPLAFAACTSAPELEDYPERQIDRPYTLPKNVSTWSTRTSVRVIDGDQGPVAYGINPLNWEQSLSKNWTLEYSPLPLAVRYQISKSENMVSGLRLATGIGYSSFSGVYLQPALSGYLRYKVASSVALENSIYYSKSFHSEESWRDWESGGVMVGPMFQLADTVSLSTGVGASVSRGELRDLTDDQNYSYSDETRYQMPANVDLRWLFHRQWEYSAGYAVNSLIVPDNGLAVHRFNMGIKHFW